MDDFNGFHVGGYTIHPYIEYLGSKQNRGSKQEKNENWIFPSNGYAGED